MKRVNVTDIPLYHKDNISTAIRVAEVLYPDGVEINFPTGVYHTGGNYPIILPDHTKMVGKSTKYDKYDMFFSPSLGTTDRLLGRSKHMPNGINHCPGIESYRNLRNSRNGLKTSDLQYSPLRECYLDNIWIAPNDTIPFRRNRVISTRVPHLKPAKVQISWMEFLKSF